MVGHDATSRHALTRWDTPALLDAAPVEAGAEVLPPAALNQEDLEVRNPDYLSPRQPLTYPHCCGKQALLTLSKLRKR